MGYKREQMVSTSINQFSLAVRARVCVGEIRFEGVV